MKIAAKRLSCSLGAEIVNLNLVEAAPDDILIIRSLLAQHCLLVFRDQHLSRAQHVGFARLLGSVQKHPFHGETDTPEILCMKSTSAIADFWHGDETFELTPPDISILNIIQCPEVGGDTIWSSLHLAYEALSDSMRKWICHLHALHVTPDGDKLAVHPVVRRNPNCGRDALYINRQFTKSVEGLTAEESDAVLSLLLEIVERPDFQCRVQWKPGSVAIWDNRCTIHSVVSDYTELRWTERVAVSADLSDNWLDLD